MYNHVLRANLTRIVLAVILLSTLPSLPNSTYAQSSQEISYSGSFTNTTFSTNGKVFLRIVFNPNNIISGQINFTEYPGVRPTCGAGEFNGQREGNKVLFSFRSNDTDPGCGFDSGWLFDVQSTISEDLSTLSNGSYIVNNSQRGVFSAISEERQKNWIDLTRLQRNYESKKGTNEAAFAHQVLCIATKSCDNYQSNGTNGWASDFVKALFEHMVEEDGLTQSLKEKCPSWMSNEACFWNVGVSHGSELLSGFSSYCFRKRSGIDYAKWDSDHENFLNHAVTTCFDEVAASGELTPSSAASMKTIIPSNARRLRESVQAICSSIFSSSTNSTMAAFPQLPGAPTKEELFSNSLSEGLILSVDAANFFLDVGSTTQIKVVRTNSDGSVSDITSSPANNYHLITSEGIVNITPEGLLSINGTSSPITSMPEMLYIVVINGNDMGVGQFAIRDIDTDSDLIVDSYEKREGLNPSRANSLTSDFDRDGITDLMETLIGTTPRTADSDGDKFNDAFEIHAGSNPLEAACTPIKGCVTSTYLPLIRR